MLDHLALQVADVDTAVAFYARVFAAAGVSEAIRFDDPHGPTVGLAGPDGMPQLWLGPLVDPGVRPVHLALTAASDEVVDQVYEAATGTGTEILHAPRVWPEYHAGYYAVFFRDPDGNNVEAVHHTFRG